MHHVQILNCLVNTVFHPNVDLTVADIRTVTHRTNATYQLETAENL